MKRIVKNLEKLGVAAEPLEFITETRLDTAEGESIIAELTAVLKGHKDLLAISAPQIGINKRVIGVKFDDGIKFFINPIITKKSDYKIIVENCVSMPGKEIVTARPTEITMVYYTNEFKYEDNKFIGHAASLFDQLAQLLDGITPADIGLVSDIEADGKLADLSDDEFAEVVDFYKQFVAAKSTSMNQAIEADSDLKSEFTQLKFTESVINGHAAIVQQEPKMNRAMRRATDRKTKSKAKNYSKKRKK